MSDNSDISKEEWYWGNVTKEEVLAEMENLEDGYFTVRDALDKKAGSYTITIRKDHSSKLLKIGCYKGLFGFHDAYKFKSVVELVNYYRSHSLSECFDQFDICLLYPLPKKSLERHTKRKDSYTNFESDRLVDMLQISLDQIGSLLEKERLFKDQLTQCQIKLDERQKFIQGLVKLQSWCEIQLDGLTNILQKGGDRKIESHQKSQEILKKKLSSLQDLISKSNNTCTQLQLEIDQFHIDIKTTNLHQNSCLKEKEQIIEALIKHGVPKEFLSVETFRLQKESANNHFVTMKRKLSKLNPIFVKDNWFLPQFTIEQSNEQLQMKENGTFLIRKGRNENTFALDIKVDDTVQHCRIYEHSDGFAFLGDDLIYRSLEELVKYFHFCSMELIIPDLMTTLEYPFNNSVEQ